MPYARPTLAEFTAVFAEFAPVTQPQFDYWIERAERSITAAFGDDQLHATQLYTAHLLAMQGLGDGIDGQRVAKFGGATSVKSDGLALTWADGGKYSTRYMTELRPLLLGARGGPFVTRSGSVPTQVNRGSLNGLA